MYGKSRENDGGRLIQIVPKEGDLVMVDVGQRRSDGTLSLLFLRVLSLIGFNVTLDLGEESTLTTRVDNVEVVLQEANREKIKRKNKKNRNNN